MIIPIAIVVGFFLIVDVFFPFYFDLRGVKPKPIESSLVTKDYRKLCDNSGLMSIPSLMISEVLAASVSLGIHKGKSVIILPTYVLDFKEEEREAIIAHELWHIKTDVEAAYLWRFDMMGGGILALLSVMIIFLIIIVEHNFFGWWSKEFSIEWYYGVTITGDLYSENIPWITFCAFVFSFCFSALVTVVRALSGFPAYIHRDSREYLADGYAALITRKPRILGKSIVESTNRAILKGIRDNLTHKIGFVNPPPDRKAKSSKTGVFETIKEDFIREFGLGFLKHLSSRQEVEVTTWPDIFSSKFTGGKHPPLEYRISFLYLLDRLLNSTIQLEWKSDPKKLTTRLKLNFLFQFSSISYGRVFSDIPMKERWNIIEKMLESKNGFALESCAKEAMVSYEDIFLVFYLLLVEGIINIIKPSITSLYEMEYI